MEVLLSQYQYHYFPWHFLMIQDPYRHSSTLSRRTKIMNAVVVCCMFNSVSLLPEFGKICSMTRPRIHCQGLSTEISAYNGAPWAQAVGFNVDSVVVLMEAPMGYPIQVTSDSSRNRACTATGRLEAPLLISAPTVLDNLGYVFLGGLGFRPNGTQLITSAT
jgi:hypothetical protein